VQYRQWLKARIEAPRDTGLNTSLPDAATGFGNVIPGTRLGSKVDQTMSSFNALLRSYTPRRGVVSALCRYT